MYQKQLKTQKPHPGHRRTQHNAVRLRGVIICRPSHLAVTVVNTPSRSSRGMCHVRGETGYEQPYSIQAGAYSHICLFKINNITFCYRSQEIMYYFTFSVRKKDKSSKNIQKIKQTMNKKKEE